jgi:hypothetical protein
MPNANYSVHGTNALFASDDGANSTVCVSRDNLPTTSAVTVLNKYMEFGGTLDNAYILVAVFA